MSASAPRTFEVRHVQLARAVFAALAAVMITFSPDHSAPLGLSVFSGFAIATGLVFLLAAWLVHPTGARWPSMLLGIVYVAAGMVAGVTALRSTLMFFAVVIAWAGASGLVETVVGARALRAARADAAAAGRSEGRDSLTIGIVTLALAAGLLLVPAQYALQYHIEDAGETFTLTGIVIAVGVFGGYAAIVAVYLGIAGFSPRRAAEAGGGAAAGGPAASGTATMDPAASAGSAASGSAATAGSAATVGSAASDSAASGSAAPTQDNASGSIA